jgi:hypothetical protein
MRGEERANKNVQSSLSYSLDIKILLLLECHLSNDQVIIITGGDK